MNVFSNRKIIAPTQKELIGGLLCWLFYLLLPFALMVFPIFHEDSLRADFLYNIAVTALSFLGVMIVFRSFLYRSRLPFLLLILTCFFGFLGMQALSSIWGLLLSIAQKLLPEAPSNMNQAIVNNFLEQYGVIMVLNVSLLAPFAEELLFRGVIFAPLCKKSPLLAYVVSMTVFSAFHIISFIGAQHWSLLLFSFLEYLPAAFVLCWSYQRSQSIWAPIVLHGLLNFYSSVLILSLG